MIRHSQRLLPVKVSIRLRGWAPQTSTVPQRTSCPGHRIGPGFEDAQQQTAGAPPAWSASLEQRWARTSSSEVDLLEARTVLD